MAKVGAKGKYTPEMVEQICKYIAEGKTYADTCKFVGIAESVFYEWKANKPEFMEAVKRAEAQYREWEDKELVKSARKSLKELILGYEYEEVTTEYIPDPSDPNAPKIKHQKRVKKKCAPNATAIIFALTNRDPENWKNRQTFDGKVDTGEKAVDLQLSKIPDDLLDKVVEALRK